jgi:hypothetical protein
VSDSARERQHYDDKISGGVGWEPRPASKPDPSPGSARPLIWDLLLGAAVCFAAILAGAVIIRTIAATLCPVPLP